MTRPRHASDTPAAHPYVEEIDAERAGWYELGTLVRSLTPAECLEPGYYRDPDWTVRDVVAHVGTWLAEAHRQLECLRAGTYDGHDVDIDAVNAALLRGMEGQPWDVAWVQAQSARTKMTEGWSALRERNDEATWWIRKAAADHYVEHLDRLRTWTADLIARRSRESA